jgi:hypothetical protein
VIARDEPQQEAIQALVRQAGYKINVASATYFNQTKQRALEFRLQWRGVPQTADVPPFMENLLSDPHVVTAQWKVS